MRKRLLPIFITVIAMVICCIGCGKDDVRTGNSNSNSVNGGWVAMENEWIYFCLGNNLYKSREDGSEKIRILVSKSSVGDLNIIDEWIYFSDYQLGLCRVQTDGLGYQVLTEEKGITNVFVLNEWIYYYNDEDRTIFKMKNDGTDKTKIYEYDGNTYINFYSINIDEDWVYYAESDYDNVHAISKVSLQDGDAKELVANLASTMVMDGEWLYYNNEEVIYRMKVNGKNEQSIVEADATYLAVADEWVYYFDYSKMGIYKVKADGTGCQKICDGQALALHVFDEWIYYYNTDGLYRVKIDGKQNQLFAEW